MEARSTSCPARRPVRSGDPRMAHTQYGIQAGAPRGAPGCKSRCMKLYPTDRHARVQCYMECKAMNPRLANAGTMQARVLARQAARRTSGTSVRGCPAFWEPCGTSMGKVRCCPSGKGTTDPDWVSPARPHWPPRGPNPVSVAGRAERLARNMWGAMATCGGGGKTCGKSLDFRDPRALAAHNRRRNPGIRFSTAATAVADLVGRR